MSSNAYQITLGTGWKRFVQDASDDMELLGVIARGAQIGALAKLAENRYAQINGDWVTPLNSGRVRRALGQSRGPLKRPPRPNAAASPATQVQVTVRKRRTVVMPGSAL